jgi:methylated-DNA-[protein]-cysteine S-methyltransferase
MKVLKYSTMETRFGTLWLAASERGLSFLLLRFFSQRRAMQELRKIKGAKLTRDDRAFRRIKAQLRSYLEGEKVNFDVDLDLSTGTPFQQSIWKLTRRIPYGRLVSYKRLAEQYGNPLCARAVGNALGANPVPIVIPCHRVIRSDSGLGGFSSGIKWKKRLIGLEQGQRVLDLGKRR